MKINKKRKPNTQMGRPLLVITSNAKILGEISGLQKKKKSITLLNRESKGAAQERNWGADDTNMGYRKV